MKRKKLKWKQILILLFILLILGCISIYGVKQYQYHQTPEYKLLQKGYNEKQVDILTTKLTNKELEEILEMKKQEKMIDLVQHQDFKFENLERYLSYQGPKNIDELIILVNQNIDQKKIEYSEQIINFLKAKYFLMDHLERYLEYQKKHMDLSIDEVITNVNSNLDYDFYTNTNKTDLSKKNLVIVNKYYNLEKDYVPENLTSIDSSGHQVTSETATHFKEMITAAKKEKSYTFKVNSAYRSYNTQASLYNNYKNQHGFAWAESYSARPGHSEHQTGLAIDMVASSSNFDNFEDTKEYEWLVKNAHKFGFIQRYPKGKEYITGYHYESWHYRYVGKEVATKIYEEGLTYEEYYAYYVK